MSNFTEAPGRTVTFSVPGQPQGKGRARSTRAGHHYTPRPTVEYETQIAWEFRKAAGSWVPLDGPVRLMVSANFEHPTTWSRAKRNRTAFCTSKPDHDNILKVVSDALNSLAWKDDQQIVASQIVKHYRTDIPPCLCITVTEA